MKVIKKLTYAQLKQMLDDGNAPMEVKLAEHLKWSMTV